MESHGILEGKDVPFVMHLRAKQKPQLDLRITIEPHSKGRSIRLVKKFVQMKRTLWESGQIEIVDSESGSVILGVCPRIPFRSSEFA